MHGLVKACRMATNVALTDYRRAGDVTGEEGDQRTETTFSEGMAEMPNSPPLANVSSRNCKELSPKFVKRARIAGLIVVTVIVWALLLIPIVIFYVSVVS